MAKKLQQNKKVKIDPDMWYNLNDLVNMNVFPWCGQDIRSYRHFVISDKSGSDLLKTMIIGSGMAKRYKIRGKEILEFYKHVDNGVVGSKS